LAFWATAVDYRLLLSAFGHLDMRTIVYCSPLICAVAVSAALALLPSWASAAEDVASQRTCAGLQPGPTRTITRILDGETVALDDGTELRLIGALAPRAVDVAAEPGAWPLEIAAREALSALVLGKSIELAFASERMDRYGRLQAQAFLIEADARRWVQGDLLEQGLARAYALAGNRGCARELLAAERAAREAYRGVGGSGLHHAPRGPAELLRHRTTFQVVEGRIVRVAQVRGVIYLNFDRNWRRGFSVSLRRDDARLLLGDHASNPKGLEGRSVRVHGWIEQHSGTPGIDLSSAGLFEVAGGTDGQADDAR
jgi:endonuclease YncB( thermonuclease family)